jgi:hypothetical protein
VVAPLVPAHCWWARRSWSAANVASSIARIKRGGLRWTPTPAASARRCTPATTSGSSAGAMHAFDSTSSRSGVVAVGCLMSARRAVRSSARPSHAARELPILSRDRAVEVAGCEDVTVGSLVTGDAEIDFVAHRFREEPSPSRSKVHDDMSLHPVVGAPTGDGDGPPPGQGTPPRVRTMKETPSIASVKPLWETTGSSRRAAR